MESSALIKKQSALSNSAAGADISEEGQNTSKHQLLDSTNVREVRSMLREQQRILDSHLHLLDLVQRNTELQPETTDEQEQDLGARPLDMLENLTYPREKTKNPLSEDDIRKWMIELEQDAMHLSDTIFAQSPTFRLLLPLNGGGKGDLGKLLDIVCCKEELGGHALMGGYVLRSLVAAGVSEWVFNDAFPNLERSDHWDEFEALFAERAPNAGIDEDEAANFLEAYRKDIGKSRRAILWALLVYHIE